jgi:perosamine synthetase
LLALLAAEGLRSGDEVILSPLTCQVVPLALLSLGVRPRWTDLDQETLNLDGAAVESRVSPRTRAVLFQHTYGIPDGAEAALAVARRSGLLFFEDCAQCMPLTYLGRCPGRLGEGAIFSNNLLKPLPAASGGLAITSDPDRAQRLRSFRDGLTSPGITADARLALLRLIHQTLLSPRTYWPALTVYRALAPAYRTRSLNDEIESQITRPAGRLSSYQERLGLESLEKAEALAAHRYQLCRQYADALVRHHAVRVPPLQPGLPLLYFPVLAENKKGLLTAAKKSGVEIIPWPGNTPIYPLENSDELIQLGYESGSCPNAERIAGQLVGLPTHLGMTDAAVTRLLTFLHSWR